MDVRERRFWVEEAARAQGMRQLMAFEAADYPNQKHAVRQEVHARYTAMLKSGGDRPMTQEQEWAANRASIRRGLPRRNRRE